MKKPEKLKRGFKATHREVTGQLIEEMKETAKTGKEKHKDIKTAKHKDIKTAKLKVTLHIGRRADLILEDIKLAFKKSGRFKSKSEIVVQLIMEHGKDIKP